MDDKFIDIDDNLLLKLKLKNNIVHRFTSNNKTSVFKKINKNNGENFYYEDKKIIYQCVIII